METNWKGINLDEVTTGDKGNGYPSNIMKAVVGFETIEQAQDYASELGGCVMSLMRKEGWNTWCRGGQRICMYDVDSEDAGYRSYVRCGDFDGLKEEISQLWDINSETSCDETYAENMKTMSKICRVFADLKDNQQIFIGRDGDPFAFEVAPQKSMSFSVDSKHYIIGVVDLFNEQ